MSKKVIVIAAVSQDGVYGIKGAIPWHIPADMKHFKEQTTGQTVVMGRGTWESLPKKFRPLPDRINMVITNTPGYEAKGGVIMKSIQQAIDAAKTEKVFLIGGHDIWYDGMSICDEALITEVRKDFWTPEPGVYLAEELLVPREKWGRLHWSSSITGENSKIPFTIHTWSI